MDCVRGVWGHEILRFYMVSSVFWELLRLFFVHDTVHIYRKLPSSISGFRSKNTTYGALASGMRSASSISGFISKNTTYGALASGLRSVSSIKREAKEQVDFSRKYSETNPLKKLDWNVTDERISFEQVRHCLGAHLHWGPGANYPCCPPPRRRHWTHHCSSQFSYRYVLRLYKDQQMDAERVN